MLSYLIRVYLCRLNCFVFTLFGFLFNGRVFKEDLHDPHAVFGGNEGAKCRNRNGRNDEKHRAKASFRSPENCQQIKDPGNDGPLEQVERHDEGRDPQHERHEG